MFWNIESLVIGVVRLIEVLLLFFIEVVLAPLDLSSELFLTYFKSIENFFVFIKGAGILLTTGIFVFQMIKVMFYRSAASNTDSPLGMIVKYIIAVGLIVSCVQVNNFILTVGKIPFSESKIGDFNAALVTSEVEESLSNCDEQIFDYTQENFAENNLNGLRTNDSSTQDSGMGMATGVITLILVLGLGISYISFIFKILKRYLLTFVTLYLSPFAYATIVSINTAGIFKKYLELVVSNLVLLFVDLLFLKLMFKGLSCAFMSTSTTVQYNPLVATALLMGFANVASTIDAKMGNLLEAVMDVQTAGRDILFRMRNLFMATNGLMG